MSSPDLSEAEIASAIRVLESGCLSIGPELDEFERAAADYAGCRYGIGVNSGTSGLHLCVIAAGVTERDLVITTPFTFVASANCVLFERGVPVFVDVEPDTGNIDPVQVAEAVRDIATGTEAALKRWLPPSMRNVGSLRKVGRLRAILPVHVFGQPADMDAISAVAEAHGLQVIEDACEALGARYKGRRAGGLGDVGVFAFYPNKQITTGEGGMLVTNNGEWAELFRSLRNQGRGEDGGWLCHERLGYNYRLGEINAAIGLTQLRRIGALLERRRRVAEWYRAALAGAEFITCPPTGDAVSTKSWFAYVVRLDPRVNRDQVIGDLAARAIPARPYFPAVHLQPFYVRTFGYERGHYPVCESLSDVSLALPFSGVMTESDVAQVAECLVKSAVPVRVARTRMASGAA